MTRTAPAGPSETNAVFTMTNAESGNEIVMYDQDPGTGDLTVIGSFPAGTSTPGLFSLLL